MSVKVLFEYDAANDDELTMREGGEYMMRRDLPSDPPTDIIENVQMMEGGWWSGERKGKTGVFPGLLDSFATI